MPNIAFITFEAYAMAQFPERSAQEGKTFDDLNDENQWDEITARDQFPVSKLIVVFCARAFADRYPSSTFPITVNCLNPGLCHSELGRDMGLGFSFLKLIFARTTEVGSRTLVHGVTQGEETHGAYISECQIQNPSALVLSEEGKKIQDRLWDEL
ncbi:hypothetical protein ACHAPQ_009100, partial [Fusarium lateritium]